MRFIATAQPFSRNRETELLIRAARTRKLENRYRFLSIRGVSFDVSRPWSSEIICCLFPFLDSVFVFRKSIIEFIEKEIVGCKRFLGIVK